MLRFDPFRDVDRLTEQLLGVQGGTARTPRFMPMDLYRHDGSYVLQADLPGIDPASVDVHVDNSTLTLKAERRPDVPDEVQWIASERFAGTFMRQLSLGDGIDTHHISAEYANGVLTVTLPVADRVKPRRIEVASGGEPTTVTRVDSEGSRTAVGATAS